MPSTPFLILIADDHADNVNLLRQLLEHAGYRTASARDGEEALQQVEALRSDLLLLDIVMPRLDGIGVIQQLRAKPEYEDLPIVVLSARSEVDRAGLFEAASGGTLFLDEIGDVPLAMQVRLLRVLQEGEITPIGDNYPRPVDVRLIASTHQDLKALVQAGQFRQDLYFRLNVIAIHLPPLRHRREDILPLAAHFLQRHCQALERPVPALAPETRRLLLDYAWPGNVRELEHEMERVIVLSEVKQPITPELLSEEVRGKAAASFLPQMSPGDGLKDLVAQMERQLIQETLERTDGNCTRAAEQLGLSRQGLIKKIQRYGLKDSGGWA